MEKKTEDWNNEVSFRYPGSGYLENTVLIFQKLGYC